MSREAQQDAAILDLLRALPEERLTGILEAGGWIDSVEETQRRLDPRRCKVCHFGYVGCRTRNEKAPEADRHEWAPDRSRSDQ